MKHIQRNKHDNIQVGNNLMQLMHILLFSVFLYQIHQVLYLHSYTMTSRNTSNVSIIFEFINSNNNINVSILSDTAILIIIESVNIIICSHISNANVIIEASNVTIGETIVMMTIQQEEDI